MPSRRSANDKRSPVDVLRVRLWYAKVLETLGKKTAYQLEKHIEPQRFKRTDGRTSYPNKVGWYVGGLRTPREAYVAMVEEKAPGTSLFLNHPVWVLLKEIDRQSVDVISWMVRLEPAVQLITLKSQVHRFGAPRTLAKFDIRLGCRLLRLGNLDSLAALLLYWKDAKASQNLQTAEASAKLIYSTLLILSKELNRNDLSAELYCIIQQLVFEKTLWLDGHFAVNPALFSQSTTQLHSTLRAYDSYVDRKPWNKYAAIAQKLLLGGMGLDAMYALQPFFYPAWEFGPPTYADWARWEEQRRHWAWGWFCLQHGLAGKMPPKTNFLRLKLKKSTQDYAYRPARNSSCIVYLANLDVLAEYGVWPPTFSDD